MQKDPKAMLLGDWIISQGKDPAISEIKYLISKSKLKGCKVYFVVPTNYETIHEAA